MTVLAFNLSIICCTVYYFAVYKKSIPISGTKLAHASYFVKCLGVIFFITTLTSHLEAGITLRAVMLGLVFLTLVCCEVVFIIHGRRESEKEQVLSKLSGEHYGL